MYDPPTLALSTVALVAIRRERIVHLILITALFTLNKETAFLVPGLVGIYWIYQKHSQRAIRQFVLLTSIYIVISVALTLRYLHNPGSVVEDHVGYLVWTYTHSKAVFALCGVAGLIGYSVVVVRLWNRIPPTLKTVQWFVPLWVAMHLLWGWPMELRVMLEILPGVMLTIIYVIEISRELRTPAGDVDAAAGSILA